MFRPTVAIISFYPKVHVKKSVIQCAPPRRLCPFFRFFYFVLCGEFNFVPSYSMVETSYNIVFGISCLSIISIFGCGSLIWLIFPTPIICLGYYLKFLTLFVVFIGG